MIYIQAFGNSQFTFSSDLKQNLMFCFFHCCVTDEFKHFNYFIRP